MSYGFNKSSIEIIELPPKIPRGMPFAVDDCSLAFHLGFRNKSMWYVLEDTAAQYKVHRIPKARGGVRVIHEPSPMMRLLQKRILIKFLAPMQERLGNHVTAYRKGRSTKDAVTKHIPTCGLCDNAPKGQTPPKHDCPRQGLYIRMDLKNFFPTTRRSWIRKYFHSLGYSHQVSGFLAGLLTVKDIPNPRHRKDPKEPKFFTGVPQGSPSAGAICNLVADQRLDTGIQQYILQLNAQFRVKGNRKWVYSRYSDDLTITAGIIPTQEEIEEIKRTLKTVIQKSGYRLNNKKTCITYGYHRRRLLGVVFNQKPNIPRDEYMRIRAIVHNCLTHGIETQFHRAGFDSVEAFIPWIRGKVNWINQVNPDKGENLLQELTLAVTTHEETKE